MIDLNARTLELLPPGRKFNNEMTKYLNYKEFRNQYVNYSNLYMNMFEWTGLPEGFPWWKIEETLFYEGRIGFAIDDESGAGLIALPISGVDTLNIYGEPTGYFLTGIGYSKQFTTEECVRVRDNFQMYAPFQIIQSECARIADAMRTIDVYSKTMKKPWLVTGHKDKLVTYKTLIERVDSNELLIVCDNQMQDDLPKAYPNNQDAKGLGALWLHKHELEDDILTLMGINNANTDKRERLITDEAQSNNILLMLNVDKALDWRLQGCKEIKEKLGLDINVKIRHDYVKEVFKTDGQMGQSNTNTSGSSAT